MSADLNDQGYQSIKKLMELLKKNPEISNELNQIDPNIQQKLAGMLFHRWLPLGALRKIIMFFFIFLSIILSLKFNIFFSFLSIIGLSFSPRITGEILGTIGVIKGYFLKITKF